ncbi:MAG: hypothetical protein QXK47_00975 [Candidatus Bathyarchaeia archaeon]
MGKEPTPQVYTYSILSVAGPVGFKPKRVQVLNSQAFALVLTVVEDKEISKFTFTKGPSLKGKANATTTIIN